MYFGTDQLSSRILSHLASKSRKERLLQDIVVVSPPERLGGRGQKTKCSSPVKLMAKDLNLQVVDAPQTAPRASLEDWKEIIELAKDFDLGVVFSFGKFTSFLQCTNFIDLTNHQAISYLKL